MAVRYVLTELHSSEGLSPIGRLRRLVHLERGDILVVVIYAIAIGLVSLAVPLASQSLINTFAFAALLQPIIVLSALVFVGLVVAGGLRVMQQRVVEVLQQRFFVRLANEAADRLVAADVRMFRDHEPRDIASRFFDVAIVQKASATLLLDALSVILQSIVSLVLLAFYHPALLAFDVVLIGAIAFVLFGLGRGGVETAITESKKKYATAAWLQHVANALRTFKSPDRAEFARVYTDKLAAGYVTARRAHFRVIMRQLIASVAVQAIATAALLGLAGYLVINNELTPGQLVAAELVVTGTLMSVAKFSKYLEAYYDLVASVDKVGQIIDLEPEIDRGITRTERAMLPTLAVVDLAEAGMTPISFELSAGEHIAVLGSDARIMRALVDTLYGCSTPLAGHVKLDGIDTRMLTRSDLRRDVALVAEDHLFEGSVLHNLGFGSPQLTADKMNRALEAVDLTREIDALPEGVNTKLTSVNNPLNGSQTARLMIARALMLAPRVLVIDETLDRLSIDDARRVLAGLAALAEPPIVIVFTDRAEIAAVTGRVQELC